MIRPRLGQGAFRVVVTDSYSRQCAVTDERILPALDAAHIRPYADGGEHEARIGLLLRRDIHSLFDAGYVTVTPEYRREVSRRIREEFEKWSRLLCNARRDDHLTRQHGPLPRPVFPRMA